MGFPRYMLDQYRTHREFKQIKRRQVRMLKWALDEVRSGAAYLPEDGYQVFNRIADDIKRLEKAVSLKKWGR